MGGANELVKSRFRPTFGVPQGSQSGPLFVLIYINIVKKCFEYCNAVKIPNDNRILVRMINTTKLVNPSTSFYVSFNKKIITFIKWTTQKKLTCVSKSFQKSHPKTFWTSSNRYKIFAIRPSAWNRPVNLIVDTCLWQWNNATEIVHGPPTTGHGQLTRMWIIMQTSHPSDLVVPRRVQESENAANFPRLVNSRKWNYSKISR